VGRLQVFILSLFLVACGQASLNPDQLVEALAGSGAAEASRQLSRDERAEFSQALIGGLKHPEARVRGQCAVILGNRNDVHFASPLIPVLDDKEAGVRSQAARSLARLLDAQQLLEILRQPQISSAARFALIEALLRIPEDLAEPQLVDYLLEPHPEPMVTHIFQCLNSTWSPCRMREAKSPELALAHQALARYAFQVARATSASPALRKNALTLYATFQGESSFETLKKIVSHKSQPDFMREGAVLGLGLCQAPASMKFLSEHAQNPNSSLDSRIAAVQGLGHLPEVRPTLENLLGNPTEEVRAQAALQLMAVGDREASKALEVALQNETGHLARPSIEKALQFLTRETCP
jgi:HEAT repeat protein